MRGQPRMVTPHAKQYTSDKGEEYKTAHMLFPNSTDLLASRKALKNLEVTPEIMLHNKLAISSPSLGRHSSHQLEHKILVAAEYGYQGIEIVYDELSMYADRQKSSLIEAAQEIGKLCKENAIEVLSLAPFENFEGSAEPLSTRLVVAKRWIDVARALGASYLQVPASYDRTSTGVQAIIVDELRQLSDLASSEEPVIKIAYEPMSWSVHISTWETALNLINQVDRPNFGMCLDSFHLLTKIWANPFNSSGKQPDGDDALARSLAQFKAHFPVEKLFFVQLSDGEKFDPPFSAHHPWYLDGEAPEFTWSKHARPFPHESDLGGYMPVAAFVRACVVDTGFQGWVSMEIFDRRMWSAAFDIADAARRGQQSWSTLLDDRYRGKKANL